MPSIWALLPSGFTAGNQFRLLWVTDGSRTAGSTLIRDYNNHVRNDANHSSVDGVVRGFRNELTALASTPSDTARDNTGTTGTGVPIYWLGGAKVADNYTDFYDGSWGLQRAPDPLRGGLPRCQQSRRLDRQQRRRLAALEPDPRRRRPCRNRQSRGRRAKHTVSNGEQG